MFLYFSLSHFFQFFSFFFLFFFFFFIFFLFFLIFCFPFFLCFCFFLLFFPFFFFFFFFSGGQNLNFFFGFNCLTISILNAHVKKMLSRLGRYPFGPSFFSHVFFFSFFFWDSSRGRTHCRVTDLADDRGNLGCEGVQLLLQLEDDATLAERSSRRMCELREVGDCAHLRLLIPDHDQVSDLPRVLLEFRESALPEDRVARVRSPMPLSCGKDPHAGERLLQLGKRRHAPLNTAFVRAGDDQSFPRAGSTLAEATRLATRL